MNSNDIIANKQCGYDVRKEGFVSFFLCYQKISFFILTYPNDPNNHEHIFFSSFIPKPSQKYVYKSFQLTKK
jgi:hypothetical protein